MYTYGTPPAPGHIGEPGTEQFQVAVWENNRLIGYWPIHDPFINTGIVVGGKHWWQRLRMVWPLMRGLQYRVSVNGSRSAHAAVFGFDYAADARHRAKPPEAQEPSS